MNTPDTLTARIDAYLSSRRQAGYALTIEGQQLKRFACFADQVGHHGPLTVKLAMHWATASRGQRPLRPRSVPYHNAQRLDVRALPLRLDPTAGLRAFNRFLALLSSRRARFDLTFDRFASGDFKDKSA